MTESRVEVLEWCDLSDSAATAPVSKSLTKLEMAQEAKSSGNDLFRSGQFETAKATYQKAIVDLGFSLSGGTKLEEKNKGGRESTPSQMPRRGDPSSPPTTSVSHASEGHTRSPPPETKEEETERERHSPESCECAAQLFANAALCEMRLDAHAAAIPLLTRAIELSPGYEKAYIRRGDCYFETENYTYAERDYRKVLDELRCSRLSHPDETELREKLSRTQERINTQTQKAMSELKDLGNTLLGKFGLSLDNFKLEKNPSSGGYTVQFQK